MPYVIRPSGATDLANATLQNDGTLPLAVAKPAGTYQVGRVEWFDTPITVTAAAPVNGIVQPSNAEPVDTDYEGLVWAKILLGGTVYVPPGADFAYVPLTLDRAPLSTVTAQQMSCGNITGGGINVGSNGAAMCPAYDPFWRPGDDLTHWITLDLSYITNKVHGAAFNFNYRPGGTGFDLPGGDHGVSRRIEFQTGAVNQLPAQMPYHRPPYRYVASGTPLAALDVATVQWSDTGYVGNASSGTPCLRSRLAHGYTQGGNKEDGLYLNADVWPVEGADAQQRIVDSAGRPAIRLHSKRLSSPLPEPGYGGAYNYGATMVTTQRMSQFNGRHGLWRSRMRTPSRRGAWSAFWCIGLDPNGEHRWPPEIDAFEHFNAGEWPSEADGGGLYTSSAVHYGDYGSNVHGGASGIPRVRLNRLGFSPDVNVYSQIHEYAVLVHQDGYVYHFRDGIETMCHYNAAVPQDSVASNTDWRYFWMFNVAVKGASATYDDGNGDLDIYSFERFTGNQITLSAMTDAKPWPNLKVSPDPVLGSETGGSTGTSGGTTGTTGGTPGTSQTWRLRVTDASGNPATSFGALEMRATAGGSDLALNRPVVASSTYPGEDAEFGVDGNTATWWSSADPVPQTFRVNLAAPASVRQITIRARSSGPASQTPRAGEVQYLDSDGVTWVTAWSFTTDAWTTNGEARTFSAPA